jgi:hypothetical protein
MENGLLKIKLICGIRSHETEVIVIGDEVPKKLQIPIEVHDGLFVLNHYNLFFIDTYNKLHHYKFLYTQGVYDRREQN